MIAVSPRGETKSNSSSPVSRSRWKLPAALMPTVMASNQAMPLCMPL